MQTGEFRFHIDEFYIVYPLWIEEAVGVGDSLTVTPQARHFSLTERNGIPVENVKYKWTYNKKKVNIKAIGQDYMITRLTAGWSSVKLTDSLFESKLCPA